MNQVGQFLLSYNTDENDLAEEFYIPVLSDAKLYKRAAGFFSSSSLLIIARGIEKLLENDGVMNLLVSPRLSPEDVEAIKFGYDSRENVIANALERCLDIASLKKKECVNYLAWLIYEKKLDIKVVIRRDYSNFGMFHDKFGIVTLTDDRKIGFRGSMNESETAFLDNYESIEVFLSDNERDNSRIAKIEQDFDRIWENESHSWETLKFPDAIRQKILQVRTYERLIKKKSFHENFASYGEIQLREYQKDAIRAWLTNRGQGILEMATGTGKTITAIAAMKKIVEQYQAKGQSFSAVIIVPYKVLLEQWEENLSNYGFKMIACYESVLNWQSKVNEAIRILNGSNGGRLFIITTNATFRGMPFQKELYSIKADILLCIDEVHHCTTEMALSSLPPHAKFRLGLSATLMNKYNSEGVAKLLSYFGNGIVYTFELKRAIEEGFLTPYYYYPRFVELTDDEKYEYYELSHKLGQLIASGYEMDDVSIQKILIRRARLIASAENKLILLKEMGHVFKDTKYNLFYCGDKIENDERYVFRVNNVLAHDLGMKTHTFTANESAIDRKRILKDFTEGDIQAITAIRCLDEGVDIPALETAFILSSGSNPKEFIQRRGRILRKHPGKDFAVIYDFIVVPSLDPQEIARLSDEEFSVEQKILLKEFQRFKEFADLAINKYDAYEKILQAWKLYEKGKEDDRGDE